MDGPIFIFGCGWRTGSTLLQRLLCSHNEIHIWGEHAGILLQLRQIQEQIEQIDTLSSRHRNDYEKNGANSWIAMMNPDCNHFQEGVKSLLEQYYKKPASELNASRWGFKEVRYDFTMAEYILKLFPNARIIFLIRHPKACLASARATKTMFLKKGLLSDVGGPVEFLQHWTRLASSFSHPNNSSRFLLLKYEEMTASPESAIKDIAAFLETDADAFDASVFGTRKRGWLGRDPRLENEDLAALLSDDLWTMARNYGYEPEN